MWEKLKNSLSDKDIKKTFISEKKTILQKLKAHQWQSNAELQETLEEFSGQPNLTVDDVLWMTIDIDPLRKFAATILAKTEYPERNMKIIGFSKGKMPKQRESLLQLLVELNGASLSRLVRLWASKEEYLRQVALEVLPSVDADHAIPVASMLLSDEMPANRLKAMSYLVSTGRPDVLWHCITLLEDPDEEIRFKTIQGLLHYSDPRFFPILLKLLQCEDVQRIRDAAIQALLYLVQSAPERYEDEVLQFLKDSDAVLRNIAARLLSQGDSRRILRKFLIAFMDTFGWVRERAIRSLKEESDRFTEGIIQLLNDADQKVRCLAENIAVTIENPKIISSLMGLLQSQDWWIRYSAAEMLARSGDPRAFQPLVQMLESEENRLFAIQALGLLKNPKAIEHFNRLSPDANGEEKLEMLEALNNINHPGAIPLLKTLYQKETDYVRTKAAELVSRMSGTAVNGSTKEEIQAVDPKTISSPETGDFLRYAISLGASDLHLSVGCKPTARIHRSLVALDYPELSQIDVQRLAVECMNDTQMSRFATQRHVDYCYKENGLGRFRTNVFLERNGMHATFRIIPRTVPRYDSVGLSPNLRDLAYLHQGLVLITGPSGCGKTTTLAAFVDLINETRNVHVITIEDPIEYVHTNKKSLISQRELGSHTNSYSTALRSALREDPDVILIGEMRDLETVRMAITAAETGHLVLSTLHTTSAANSIDRVISSFPPQEQPLVRTMLSESLKAVVSQVLLPNPNKDGLVPAFEILFVTQAVASLIREAKTFQIPSVQQTRQDLGMCLLDQSLLKLLEQKKADPTAAFARAINKELVEPFLGPGV